LLVDENEVIKLIVERAPLPSILTQVARAAERQRPRAVASGPSSRSSHGRAPSPSARRLDRDDELTLAGGRRVKMRAAPWG
jgi:hypothetical protein